MHQRSIFYSITSVMLSVIIMTCTLFGCSSDINATSSVSDEEVVLKIAGSWPDCRALELVASEFSKKYPNCTISYEYLQDYTPSLMKRMEGEESIDSIRSSLTYYPME